MIILKKIRFVNEVTYNFDQNYIYYGDNFRGRNFGRRGQFRSYSNNNHTRLQNQNSDRFGNTSSTRRKYVTRGGRRGGRTGRNPLDEYGRPSKCAVCGSVNGSRIKSPRQNPPDQNPPEKKKIIKKKKNS